MATQAQELPFARRLKLYLDERFPLATHLVVVFAFFLSNYFLTERLLGVGSAPFGWRAVGGMVTVLLSFFLLRVFDEFKDYDKDVVAHPDRVVSRGLMPLSELRVMGWVVLGAMVAINLAMGPWVLATYLLVLLYSWLMFKEFYVGAWLNRHLFVYALSHQIITPLLCVYVYMLAAAVVPQASWHNAFVWQLLMGAGTGLGWEMARKVRAPEEEHPQIDTYSQIFGMKPAAAIALGILFAGAGFAMAVGPAAGFPVWAYAMVTVAMAITAFGFFKFFAAPTARGARKLSDWAAILMLLSYLAVAAGSAAGHGVHLAF